MRKFLSSFLRGASAFFMPVAPAAAPVVETPARVAKIAPLPKKAVQQGTFVHLVGDFNKAKFQIEGKDVDLKALEHVAATKTISEYFKVRAGDITYVLWNNPDKIQRTIQAGRKDHYTIESADKQVISLNASHFEVHDEKSHMVNMVTPRESAAAEIKVPTLDQQVEQKADELRKYIAQRRSERSPA